jgi:hypothetical protein
LVQVQEEELDNEGVTAIVIPFYFYQYKQFERFLVVIFSSQNTNSPLIDQNPDRDCYRVFLIYEITTNHSITDFD